MQAEEKPFFLGQALRFFGRYDSFADSHNTLRRVGPGGEGTSDCLFTGLTHTHTNFSWTILSKRERHNEVIPA